MVQKNESITIKTKSISDYALNPYFHLDAYETVKISILRLNDMLVYLTLTLNRTELDINTLSRSIFL